MSKVIGLNGSPRKNANSAQMLKSALDGAASAGAETELINLVDLKYTGCLSCFACKRLGGPSYGRCALNDDLKEVLDKILDADALIVSAPIYYSDVPGMVRNFFERILFPGNQYRKDRASAYEKRVKTGLIYTMNHDDEELFSPCIKGNEMAFNIFVGDTESLCSVETLQHQDYTPFTGDIFDVEARKKRHEEVFPLDCKKAFELGKRLAE